LIAGAQNPIENQVFSATEVRQRGCAVKKNEDQKMNMITPVKFLKEDAEVAESNPALKRLMAAWENKQAKNARKIGGFGLMAVSLAACGGSSGSDPDPVDPDPVTPVGQTFVLTTAVDIFTGGEGDDIFNAPLADASGSLQGLLGIQTLGGQDVLNGGEGRDTLNAELNATGTTQNPTLIDIEVLNFTVMPLPALGGILGGAGIIDLHRSEGYEEIWNINSRFDLAVLNVRTDDDGTAPAIGMAGVLGTDQFGNQIDFYVQYDFDQEVAVQNVIATNVGSAGSGSASLGIVVDGGIETLNLQVSNGVRLDIYADADGAENLNISGSGLLELDGDDNFPNLVTLDSTGYTGDLALDVSGSGTLESVLTGAGDDAITAAVANFSAETPATTVNLGAGENRLILEDTFQVAGGTYTGGGLIDSDELSAIDFTLAPVSNVQTLELVGVDINGDASLALEGVGGLETLVFNGFDNAGDDLTVTGSPETLLISATDEFEMDGGLFTIEGAVDLTIETTGTGDSDVRLDGGVNSETLETLVINAADDAELWADGGLDALTSIEVNALGDDADVTLENFDGDEFGALESVAVFAAVDADLEMSGRAPVQQQQTFFSGGAPAAAAAGTITFAYIDANGDPQTVNATNLEFGFGNDEVTAANIATAFNDLPEFTASSTGATVTIIRVDAGEFPPITLASVTGGRPITNNGVTVDGVEGAGFEALEDVVVIAGEDADVELTDVYGAFTVDVTAGMNVEYNIVGGDIVGFAVIDTATVTLDGNPNLVSLNVSGAQADVTLEGDLGSMLTIDLTGVTEQFIVDATNADFGWDIGESGFVTYLIGGTSSEWDEGYSTIDSSVDNRETFKFTEADFGTVVIDGFDVGAGGDRIDLSELGFTNEGQLVIEQGVFNAGTGEFTVGAGADARIIDDAGGPEFSGTIILQNVVADDLTSNNITF